MPAALKLGGEDWQAFDDVYREFAEANPVLGLNPSEFASTRLRQQYGDELLRAGAALRLPNRRWLAHPNKFGAAVFEAMARRSTRIVAQARARAADEAAADQP